VKNRTHEHIPASQITPEAVYRARRQLLGLGLASPLLALAGCAGEADAPAPAAAKSADSRDGFLAGDEQTRFEDATSFNNFYEFGTGKGDPALNAHTLKPSPWSVVVGGAAEVTGTFALDDFLKPQAVEDRIYRLRCVEGWSMLIPWQGVALGEVLRRFRPSARAKFVAFTTLADRDQMPGLRFPALEWPCREGLRMDEAMNPLSLLATGMYGKPLPHQNGAPLRLVVPWKYGFKSIKSIVRIDRARAGPAAAGAAGARRAGRHAGCRPGGGDHA